MRIQVPNPFGPPITIDTEALSSMSIPRSIPLPAALRSSRRAPLRLAMMIFCLVALFTIRPAPPFPPNYSVERGRETSREWMSSDAVFPEGREGRYLMFDTHQGEGFNHQLQSTLLHHHLAILSNRSLAYEPIVQDDTWLPFKLTLPPWRTARIPLSAYISTVISGFERHYDTPRAVPASYFRKVCPRYKQHILTLKDDRHPNGDLDLVGDGQTRIHQLQVTLGAIKDGCVKIQGNVFDDEFFNSAAPVQLYETFAKSPVLAQFTFSPTVLSVLNRMVHTIAPESGLYDVEGSTTSVSAEPRRINPTWKHVLALHLRRGDGWQALCEDKGRASAPFVAFNKLPKLPGNENIPPPPEMAEPSRMGLYKAKCDPQVLDIIARARRMRKNHPLLRAVYIMTDGPDKWVEEVRMWLLSEGWDAVWVGNKDVYPSWQEKEIGVAVDMEVARRAGVFVGNGFSTTSSNIVLLRSRDNLHPDLTQFW